MLKKIHDDKVKRQKKYDKLQKNKMKKILNDLNSKKLENYSNIVKYKKKK